MTNSREAGIALLITMFTLVIISIIGLVMALNAITEVKISDNYESHFQAEYAAMAGLNHARLLLDGLDFDVVLKGPDGMYDTSTAYIKEAKTFRFRLPIPVSMAQTMNIESPLSDIGDISDDGIISTGVLNGIPGTELIPKSGIGLFAGDPYRPEQLILSRYFVKVTDNNGEASELAADAANNPFIDGDGIVIVRSVGVSRTLSEQMGTNIRRNSVAVFEARFRRAATWDTGTALTVLGSSINAAFADSPEITGGAFAGIGVLDTNPDDSEFPDILIKQAAEGIGGITGGGLTEPSVRDISAEARGHRDRAALFNAEYLWNFIQHKAPAFADQTYDGDQVWGTPPFLGTYDMSKPWNDPTQKPRITLVKGNLTALGGISGAGILIITGSLECSGNIDFRGLILTLGSGRLILHGSGPGIKGGVLAGSLVNSGGVITFGVPLINIGGDTRITADKASVRMALRLLPVEQISFREIAGSDP